MKYGLKYTKPEDIDEAIEELEYKQCTENLSVAEEKEIIKQMQALRV